MVFPESALVVLTSTLAGGIPRSENESSKQAQGNPTCGQGTRWIECHVLDEHIHATHLMMPWVITLCSMMILSMPTLLLRSRLKEKGLRTIAGNLFYCLGLLLCSFFVSDHPAICLALTMHSCLRLLIRMDTSDAMLGGGLWWSLRYVSAVGILLLQVFVVPSLSVVRWPSTLKGSAIECAYLAHLAGCIIPDLVISCMRAIISTARYVQIRDE
jgi:hypothetical protein